MKNQRTSIKWAFSAVSAIAASSIPILANAQTTSSSPTPTPVVLSSGVLIFEDITLTPNFTPNPAIVRGFSGGELTAEEVAGRAETPTGVCTGFVDAEPDHQMTLTSPFQVLSLLIQSTDDTTLIIRGPGGVWCNDTYTDWNPGIAGQWLSGTYDIWVGSYNEGTYHPYVLNFSETLE